MNMTRSPADDKPYLSCESCAFGTNDEAKADAHMHETGHTMTEPPDRD